MYSNLTSHFRSWKHREQRDLLLLYWLCQRVQTPLCLPGAICRKLPISWFFFFLRSWCFIHVVDFLIHFSFCCWLSSAILYLIYQLPYILFQNPDQFIVKVWTFHVAFLPTLVPLSLAVKELYLQKSHCLGFFIFCCFCIAICIPSGFDISYTFTYRLYWLIFCLCDKIPWPESAPGRVYFQITVP